MSRETLRGWMVADRLWLDWRARLPSPHQPWRRRECLGELVQIDGSEHAWFEGPGPGCTLLAFVDDATSRLMLLRFVASESAFSYFVAVRSYLEAHSEPVAFYSDKHRVFRVNRPGPKGDDVTQFGCALCELNVERRRSPDIDIICANSPQAKGRVERAFGTLQDRLMKELRLAGVTGVEAGNVWLPGFVVGYNARFGREPLVAKVGTGAVVENRRLSEVLAHVKAQQAAWCGGSGACGEQLGGTWRAVRRRLQCHLYFACAMTSLSCIDKSL